MTNRPTIPSLSTVQALAIASQFGVSLAVAVGLGLFVGQWVDTQLHTGVAFTLAGVFLGLAAAVTTTVQMYRVVLRRNERQRQEREWAETAPPDS